MAISIRAAGLLLLAALIASCGGGGDTAPPTAPPQPPPLVPATLSVSAGDGQEAEPNGLVATAPTVVVRSSSGAAVPNVVVAFAVDSGGGSVASPTATTDANGLASVSSWRLGAAEGPQLLTATVASLAPVRIRATARIVQRTVVTQTVDAAGGTLTVNRIGSPIHGAQLQLDKSAVNAATTIRLVETSMRGITVPAGMQVLSPGLGIAGSGSELMAPALITFPATPVSGKVLMMAVADPGSGRISLLPTVSATTTSITALLPALDARTVSVVSALLPSKILAVGAQTEELKSIPFLIGINEELLAGPIDVGFRPGADDWPFRPIGIAALPFLTLVEDEIVGKVGVANDGMVSTALWYYANRRKQGGPPLNGLTQEIASEPLSARRGIKWAALAEANVPSFNQTGSLAALEWDDFFTEDRARFARLQFLAIKALMLTTERPTPVVLLSTNNPNEFNAESAPLAIAYKIEGNTLSLAIADEPGREFQVQFTEQGMVPFRVARPSGTTKEILAVAGVHYINVVNNTKLAEQWTRVANGTIGNAEGWPTPVLHWEKAPLDTAKVYLLDELQHWWQCTTCEERLPRPEPLPVTASHVLRTQFGKFENGQFGGLTASAFSSMRFSSNDMFKGTATSLKVGSVILHPLAASSELGVALGWLDYITTTYRKLTLTPSARTIAFSKDTSITVTVAASETPPAGTRYRWHLKTETGQDSAETSVPSHTRSLKADASGWLIVTALEGEHKRPIARDSVEMKVESAVAAWRLTSLVDADSIFDEDFPPTDVWADLVPRVGSGLLIVEAAGADTVLRLRVKRSGVWTAADCCPVAAFNPALERELVLGMRPARPNAFGGYFSRWAQTVWSQSSPDLNSGAFTGTSTFGATQSWTFESGGSQNGPGNGLQFSASRNGLQLSGVITVAGWPLDFDTREIDDSPEFFRLLITGTRLR